MDFQELDRRSIRTGCETDDNRLADLELRRRGYVFDATQAKWITAGPAPDPQICCCEPTPDRSGRRCDKPKGHEGPHWTYGGNALTWERGPAPDPQERPSLTRYTPGGEWWDQMVEAPYGKYVLAEDVQQLEAEASTLRARNAELEHEIDGPEAEDFVSLTQQLREAWSQFQLADSRLSTLRAQLDGYASVCSCGCPVGEHENYGDDGESCENDDHECIRTSAAVADMLEILRSENTALRARLALPPWQPIETAPKDGHSLLVLSGGSVIAAWWNRAILRWEWADGWHAGEVRPSPTHWMPLPPPPTADQEQPLGARPEEPPT